MMLTGHRLNVQGKEKRGCKDGKEAIQHNHAKQIWEEGDGGEGVFTLRKGITKGRRGKLVAS